MAKRGVPEHPKTLKLARRLGVEPWAAVGLLEVFWHWCSKYAITGLVTASPEDIADGIRYSGDADALFAVMLECGWIDAHPDGFTIHDVADHADNTWKANLKRAGLEFWNDAGSTPSDACRDGAETEALVSCDRIMTESQPSNEPPKPEPEPEPKPEPKDILGGQAPPGEPGEGEPSSSPEPRKKPPRGVSADVAAVFEALNSLSGRRFDPGGAQAQYVRGRLKCGATVEQLVLVVEHRVALWAKDPKMREYLRPETLFGAAKFENYLPLAREWDNAGRPPPETGRSGHSSTNGRAASMPDRAEKILAELRGEA